MSSTEPPREHVPAGAPSVSTLRKRVVWVLTLLWAASALWGIGAFVVGSSVGWWWPTFFAVLLSLLILWRGEAWWKGVSSRPDIGHSAGYLVALVLAPLTLGLAGAGIVVGYVGLGTDGPPSDSIRDPIIDAAAVYAYAGTLTYDTTHSAVDEQWLEVWDSANGRVDSIIGPRAKIEPAKNSHRNNRRAITGTGPGKGRIVARITVEGDKYRGGGGYEKLKLPVGVSYLWIDNRREEGDSVTARALIITPTSADSLRHVLLSKSGFRWTSHAEARWQFHPNDPCICQSCMTHTWCQVCGGS
jgi:hypothetical protein